MTKSRWISDLHWRRKGRQTRSEVTQSALLDAAEALLLQKGADATSVADIAEKAGSSVGAVYHHFKDKTALLYSLFHRMTEAYEALTEEAIAPERWEGATIADILRGYIEYALEPDEDRTTHKAAALLVAVDNPELRAHHAELQRAMHQGLQRLLLARKHEIGHRDPEAATSFLIDQLSAMLRARLDKVRRSTQLSKATDEQFTEETLGMASAFLQLKE